MEINNNNETKWKINKSFSDSPTSSAIKPNCMIYLDVDMLNATIWLNIGLYSLRKKEPIGDNVHKKESGIYFNFRICCAAERANDCEGVSWRERWCHFIMWAYISRSNRSSGTKCDSETSKTCESTHLWIRFSQRVMLMLLHMCMYLYKTKRLIKARTCLTTITKAIDVDVAVSAACWSHFHP